MIANGIRKVVKKINFGWDTVALDFLEVKICGYLDIGKASHSSS